MLRPGHPLAGFAEAHGGNPDSEDALVVLRTVDGSPANKRFLLEDGKPAKKAAANAAQYFAWQVAVPTPEAMRELLQRIGSRSDYCLMLGRFPGPPSGEFRVMSRAAAAEAGGTEDGWFRVNRDEPAICRTEASTLPSSWLLLDRDFNKDQPDHLVFPDTEVWWEAMCEIAPGLRCAARVDLPSTSARVVDENGKPLFSTASSHHFVQLRDATDLARLGPAMLAHAMLKGIGWRRQWGGRATRAWSIFDPSTFSWERLCFDGAPVTEIPDTRITPPVVTLERPLDDHGDGRFDSRALPTPAGEEKARLRKDHGLDLREEKAGGIVRHHLEDTGSLQLSTPIRVVEGGKERQSTVRDLWMEGFYKPDLKHRIQAPFRESNSEAGIFRMTPTGLPVVFDVGPGVLFRLSGDDAKGPDPAEFLTRVRSLIGQQAIPDQEIEHAIKAWAQACGRHGYTKTNTASGIEELAGLLHGRWGNTPPVRRKMLKDIVMDPLGKAAAEMKTRQHMGEGYLPLDDKIEAMNQEMAVVMVGGKATVAKAGYNHTFGHAEYTYADPKDIRIHVASDRAIMADGSLEAPFPHWIGSERRNTLPGVSFKPECSFAPDKLIMPRGQVLNPWIGYQYLPIDPAADPEAAAALAKIKYHILAVFCGDSEEKYAYFMDWLALLIQQPDLIGMPVIVLQSVQGAGKGVIVDHIIAPLFGPHALIIEKPEHLTGRFNAHLGINAFISVNEAVWGGDKQRAGAYKAIITDGTRVIEQKFKDVYPAKNYSSLMVSTNEDWFAPMDIGDRRHAVFDCSNAMKGNHAYFRDLVNAIVEQRGRQAFLHELLHRQVDENLIRRPPTWRSAAADTNMLRSIAPEWRFLYQWFNEGQVVYQAGPTRDHKALEQTDAEIFNKQRHEDQVTAAAVRLRLDEQNETTFAKEDIYQAYAAHCRTSERAGNAKDPRAFWQTVRRLGDAIGPDERRSSDGQRFRAVTLAPVPVLRAAFNHAVGRDIQWDC